MLHNHNYNSVSMNGFLLVAMQDGPVEILPFLFLGSAHHSSRREALEARGITAVLNVSSSCPNLFESELRYKSIPVEDSQAADISAWFPAAIDFIGTSHTTRYIRMINTLYEHIISYYQQGH